MTQILTEPIAPKKKGNGSIYLAYTQATTDTPQPVTSQYTKYEDNNYSQLWNREKPKISLVTPFSDTSFKTIESKNKNILNNAFDRITNAHDVSLSVAERSNYFDEWKDILNLLARIGDHFTSSHRKILGTLIISTKQKDISDFKIQSLKAFIEATNVLRQPRITKPECKRVIKILLDNKINAVIAMNPDSIDEEKIKSLEAMMDDLLEKDNLTNE
jgi:hypothetical protein